MNCVHSALEDDPLVCVRFSVPINIGIIIRFSARVCGPNEEYLHTADVFVYICLWQQCQIYWLDGIYAVHKSRGSVFRHVRNKLKNAPDAFGVKFDLIFDTNIFDRKGWSSVKNSCQKSSLTSSNLTRKKLTVFSCQIWCQKRKFDSC